MSGMGVPPMWILGFAVFMDFFIEKRVKVIKYAL